VGDRSEPATGTAATATTRSTCPYCGVGCGVLAVRRGEAGIDVAGDPDHPANRGQLCVKGSALAETLGLQGRLLQPERRVDGGFAAVSWASALDEVAGRFAAAIAAHGPDAVAMYVSGQLLTEDYYVANKFMKGYVGSANIDTNSRLCMASSVAGHRRAFGEDVVPVDYADIDAAGLLVLVGSNAAWCHPVLHRRIRDARARAPANGPPLRVIVIDPRRTSTCDDADMHLPIRPGTDVALFAGLLAWLAENGGVDAAFVADHCSGFVHALAVARAASGGADHVARACGLQVADLLAFYRAFAAEPRTITLFSQGVNQSTAGTDKVNAIINCHLATGRIGRAGAGPFSITGQPNAMGGREVGGLANQLAVHLQLEHPGHRALVQSFWGSPAMAARAGLKAVELFDAVAAGRIRALWIMGTNPLVSLPDANAARAALAGCEFVVVSDIVRDTETTRLAHLRLPALGWGEKDGTVTNSERCISRQRAFLPAPGAARADWWAIAQVAARLGHGAAFAYASAHEIFVEHARLSAAGQREFPRVFDLGALAALDAAAYDALAPVRWPLAGSARPFADGRFMHDDGRARFVATWPRGPAHGVDDAYPFALNTGRLRDHWHTMTRTGRAPTLAQHREVPEVEVHPQDALAMGIVDGGLVRLDSRWGSAVVQARTSTEVMRRALFAPIHWNDAVASDAGIGRLVNPSVDPVSGEPEFKHTPAAIRPFHVDWHGFVLLRGEGLSGEAVADALGLAWWVRIQEPGCVAFRMAGRGARAAETWRARLDALVGRMLDARAAMACAARDVRWLEYSDPASAVHRAVALLPAAGGNAAPLPLACVFAARSPAALPARTWLAAQFAVDAPPAPRWAWLRGAAGAGAAPAGRVVCACHGVRDAAIVAALHGGLADDVASLGTQLRCGTGCGSCIPELRRLLEAHREGRV
jgi:assimilatory nitrate reductase catalytic subunit